MNKHISGHPSAPIDINHLRRGNSYRAHSHSGRTVTGVYLGIEVAYDQWRILLQGHDCTASVAIDDLHAVLPTAV